MAQHPSAAIDAFPELSPRDRFAIGDVFTSYALGTDMADRDLLARIFVANAVLTGSIGAEPPFLDVAGSDRIIAHVVETRRRHGYSERHLITNLSARPIAARTARAQAYFLVTRMDGKAVINSATGSYEADLVRDDDLTWRIERIAVYMDGSLI